MIAKVYNEIKGMNEMKEINQYMPIGNMVLIIILAIWASWASIQILIFSTRVKALENQVIIMQAEIQTTKSILEGFADQEMKILPYAECKDGCLCDNFGNCTPLR